MNEWMLLILFIVSAVLGYAIIRNVPALMHTPLMSGMNALSGITVIGAMVVTADASFLILRADSNIGFGAKTLGLIAVVLAMVNVVGGFALTHRMLRMIAGKKKTADATKNETADAAEARHNSGDNNDDMTKGGAS